LEDKGRGVAPNNSGVPPVKKKPHEGDRLTIMIIRSLGRVRSFKISPHIAFWAILFFILYIPFSAFIINNYIELYRAKKSQSTKIEQLEKEIIEGEKNLHRFRQHVTLLEDYIRHLEEPNSPQNEKAATRGNEYVKQKSATPKVEIIRKETVITDAETPAMESEEDVKPIGAVDIKDMIIQKEGARMNVEFKLVNMNPGETAVGGYIHLIAMGNDPNPPPEWTFPRVQLEQGMPVNFRRGQLFLIQRFKPVHGRFFLTPNSEPPTALKVLVYDQSGLLILEREFEVSHVS
jgi:cell division protein FtsB